MPSTAASNPKTDALSRPENQGESVTVTPHDQKVEQRVPAPPHDPERVRAAIRRMQDIAAGQTLGGDWRDFRDAGRTSKA